jgi:hypothetical protein
MQSCLSFAMQASLEMQRWRARAKIRIEASRCCCRLSRERLQASKQLPHSALERTPILVTVTPGCIASRSLRHLVLLSRGRLHVEECVSGGEYGFARDFNAGLIGIYECRDDAEAAVRRFSTGQQPSVFF